MKKISVIVPVYNVEEYLTRCLESLVNQTLKEIEIIVVNDASPDESYKIMKRYEAKYPEQVKCLYLSENQRLGGARNRGTKIAQGEYITYVDSDDWLELSACEKMYGIAKKTNSDVVFCNYQVVAENLIKRRNKAMVYAPQMGDMTDEKRKSLLFTDSCAWGKLIKRELIERNQISYPEHVLYEDAPTTPFYYLYASHIEKIEESLYFYYERKTSITHERDADFQFDFSKMALHMLENFKKRGFFERYQEEIMMRFTKEFYLHPLLCSFQRFSVPPVDYFYELRKKMQEIYPKYYENRYLWQKYEPLPVQMAMWNDKKPEYMVSQYENCTKNDIIILYEKYYQKQSEKLAKVLDYIREKKYNMACWGAGDMGVGFLKIFDSENNIVSCVFDKNEKLHDETLKTGHKVYNFQKCPLKIDLILVVNTNYYIDIKEEIKSYNDRIKVLNLDEYLKNDFLISEWVE